MWVSKMVVAENWGQVLTLKESQQRPRLTPLLWGGLHWGMWPIFQLPGLSSRCFLIPSWPSGLLSVHYVLKGDQPVILGKHQEQSVCASGLFPGEVDNSFMMPLGLSPLPTPHHCTVSILSCPLPLLVVVLYLHFVIALAFPHCSFCCWD